MRIETSLTSVVLRPWAADDSDALVAQADDRQVWRNLFAGFPHPYTAADARFWCTQGAETTPGLHLCVQVDGAVAGGIGVTSGTGTEERTGQFGYWLGRSYWGRGIATAAARAMLGHVRQHMALVRLQAIVFEWNPASMRVLEKVGFTREAILRQSVSKDGHLIDSVVYVHIADHV